MKDRKDKAEKSIAKALVWSPQKTGLTNSGLKPGTRREGELLGVGGSGNERG